MTVLTIRDVPDDVRDSLALEASARGQSLQAYLRGLLLQRVDFIHNVQQLAEIAVEIGQHGAGTGSPDPGDVIRAARRESGRAR